MYRSCLSCLAVAWMAALAACAAPPPPAEPTAPAMTPVERGAYLVNTAACHDCHTPAKMGPNGPEPDMTRALSGHPEGTPLTKPPALTEAWPYIGNTTFTAWAGPWGMSFTANLTPDQNTGLCIWSEEMFL